MGWIREGLNKFQSAPPVETRGDKCGYMDNCARKKFQSAPPVETRGDPKTRLG